MLKMKRWQTVFGAFFMGTALYAAEAAIAEEASSYTVKQRAVTTQSDQAATGGRYGDRSTRLVGSHAQNIPALEASGGVRPGISALRGNSDGLSSPPHQIGYGRELPAAMKVDALAGLSWQKQTDGSITALQRVRSEGAVGLRLGMRIAPEFNGELRFAPAGNPADAIGPFTRRDWEGMAVYWSPLVESDDMLIEIRMSDGKMPPEGSIGFSDVSHIYELPGAAWSNGSGNSFSNVYPSTLSCNNEAACAKTEAEKKAVKATAQMTFSDSSGSYVCTGTLIADQKQSGTPYFYTAYHCISDATMARTLETRWNYQYPSCAGGSGKPSGTIVLSGGADYLQGDYNNDHSLLRLRGTPPADAVFLGWSTNPLDSYDPVVEVHHPQGDVKKISWGAAANPPTISTNVSGEYHTNLWKVILTDGVIQGGSSGSGLLSCSSTDCKLIGGLFGGDSSGCSGNMVGVYSKFSVAYPALSPWLGESGGSVSPVLKVAKTATYAGDGMSSVQISIQRTNGTSSGSTVQYATNAGTAQPGIDFTVTSGVLNWSAGQTEKTITVPLLSATRANADKYFDFVLTNPSGATVDVANGKTRITLLAAGATTANRIFKWAEATFPQLLAPTAQTQTAGDIFYRYYSGTKNYLGIQKSEVLFLGAGQGEIMDLGPLDNWMPQVIQAGY